jgi:hypothetical protein
MYNVNPRVVDEVAALSTIPPSDFQNKIEEEEMIIIAQMECFVYVLGVLVLLLL